MITIENNRTNPLTGLGILKDLESFNINDIDDESSFKWASGWGTLAIKGTNHWLVPQYLLLTTTLPFWPIRYSARREIL